MSLNAYHRTYVLILRSLEWKDGYRIRFMSLRSFSNCHWQLETIFSYWLDSANSAIVTSFIYSKGARIIIEMIEWNSAFQILALLLEPTLRRTSSGLPTVPTYTYYSLAPHWLPDVWCLTIGRIPLFPSIRRFFSAVFRRPRKDERSRGWLVGSVPSLKTTRRYENWRNHTIFINSLREWMIYSILIIAHLRRLIG